jgi:hypothetical protein
MSRPFVLVLCVPYKDPNRRKEALRTYYHQGPGKEKHRQYHLGLKLGVFAAYGGAKCVGCGFEDHRALNLDHIAGGGSEHRRNSPSGTIYLQLKRLGYPEGYQVLCANCNSIKKYTHNEFNRGK